MIRKICFNAHWLVGITAGVVLAVVGVSGALLSFEPEILRWLNSGLVSVNPITAEKLDPALLREHARAQLPDRTASAFQLFSDPALSARIGFAPVEAGALAPNTGRRDGARKSSGQASVSSVKESKPGSGRARLEWRYADPYTGKLLGEGEPRGEAFLH